MNKGVIAGNFDVIHPGYVKTFKECKENCDHFTILLHSDPTIERPNKLKPILNTDERIEILSSIKYIDEIQVYTYEKELIEILKNGDLLIEESNYGRTLYFNADGSLKWTHLNRAENGNVHAVGWSRILYTEEDLQTVNNFLINKGTCNE